MSKNVLFVDAAQCYGGAQRSLGDLMFNLDQERVKPFLLVADETPDGLLLHASQNRIPFEPLPIHQWGRSFDGIMSAARDIINARKVVRELCRAHQIDLLYANGIQAGLLCAIDRPSDVPFIFHNRDYRCPDQALKYVVRRAETTLAISEFIRKQTVSIVGDSYADRVRTVLNGLNFPAIDEQARDFNFRTHFTYPTSQRFIAIVADMVDWKRHDLFLDAFALVHETHPDVFALVIGGARDETGFLQEEVLFRKAEKLGLLDSLLFTGHVANPYPLMNVASTIVSTAENEPFGRTIVEALHLGKPVVTVKGGGPEEIAHGSPAVQLVDPTAESVAAGIRHWLDLGVDATEEVAAQARAAAEPYSLRAHMDAIMAILDEKMAK